MQLLCSYRRQICGHFSVVAQTATREMVNGDVPGILEKICSVSVDARCFRFPLHRLYSIFLYSRRCRGSSKKIVIAVAAGHSLLSLANLFHSTKHECTQMNDTRNERYMNMYSWKAACFTEETHRRVEHSAGRLRLEIVIKSKIHLEPK